MFAGPIFERVGQLNTLNPTSNFPQRDNWIWLKLKEGFIDLINIDLKFGLMIRALSKESADL